jgi:flavodoxin
MQMQRSLVVYFSRTGYTKRIAEEIATRLDADIEAIEDVRGRAGIFGYVRSAREAYKRRAASIRPAGRSPGDYDLVVLGGPVWAGNMCSPVRAYLARHAGEIERIAIFTTLGGSGAENVLSQMTELSGCEPIARLAITDREIRQQRYATKLEKFVTALGLPKAV